MAIHTEAVNRAPGRTAHRRRLPAIPSVDALLLLLLATAGRVLGQGTVEDPTTDAAVELLPGPVATENSLELCLNSRYSEHALSGAANSQQTAHVLWAAGRMPVMGAYRRLWLITKAGTYLYDPAGQTLTWDRPDRIAGPALVITYEAELAFDVGLSYMAAILASVSLWGSDDLSLSCCPQGTELRFGVQQVRGLTSELVAHSSVPVDDPGWLPDPCTAGGAPFEWVLDRLWYTGRFARTALTLKQLSQILWAGYGCTPHTTFDGKAGLTVPSAYASYYLAGAIYVVNERGAYRYLNRNSDDDPAVADHRMEQIRSGDLRERLRDAVATLPQTPCCIVLCLQEARSEQYYAQLEVGFVAGNMLMQAAAIDLGCHFLVKLSLDERQRIQSIAGIPEDHIPQSLISVGRPAGRPYRARVPGIGEP